MNDAQLDGFACTVCGGFDGPMVPVGRSSRGQIFAHVDCDLPGAPEKASEATQSQPGGPAVDGAVEPRSWPLPSGEGSQPESRSAGSDAASTRRSPGGGAPAPVSPPADLPERHRQPRREVTRAYACPECGAEPGQPCQGRRGDRKSHHFSRVELATELRYGQRLRLPRSIPTSLPDDAQGVTVKARSADPVGVDSVDRSVSLLDVGDRAASPPLNR